MTADPRFLLANQTHREALAGLSYGILQRKGLIVLTGDAGTGKTTLLSRLMECLPRYRTLCSLISHPTLEADDFLELMLVEFGVSQPPISKARRIVKLKEILVQADQQQNICVVIVDEAHKVNPDVLEEIRLLGNLEQGNRKLLQLVLAGQNELDAIMNQENLRQFKQRIAIRLRIQPFTSSGVGQYIEHRWRTAGGTTPHPFSPDAVQLIAKLSTGIPRLINSICDNALLIAYAEEARGVEVRQVEEACRDLHWLDGSAPVVVTQPPVSPAEAIRVPVVVPHPAGPAGYTEQRHPEPQPTRLARWASRFRLSG